MPTEYPVLSPGLLAPLSPAAVIPAATLPAFDTIVAQSAHATGCAAGILCTVRTNGLVVLAATRGAIGSLHPVLRDAPADAPAPALMVRDLDGSPVPVAFHGEDAELLRFAVAVTVSGTAPVWLILLDTRTRAGLSPAQTYVLRAHAAHLATLLQRPAVQIHGERDAASSTLDHVERLRLLETVAVHARDSIVITEAEPVAFPGPRILYCNAAFTEATGYTADQAIGRTPRILQGPKTDLASRARLRHALETWRPIEIELINYRRDGTEFWVELSIVPVANEQGAFTHWISVQRDVTERRAAEELTARIRAAELANQVLAGEILERKRIEAELLYTAFHDNLTRLRNRAFFMERLSQALERGRIAGAPGCAVMFLDLDRFKVVNDSLGHIAGDALMREVAARLRRCVRPQDTLARIGGDEFAILVEDTADLATPIAIAEAILRALRAPVQLGRQSVFPSCSIGLVPASEPGVVPDDLMRDADIAMYQAKRAGGGDYAIFDATLHQYAVDKLSLQTDLQRAVERGEFHLAYQPIVDPATRRILSFEALVRWNHPVRGTISPAEFVPVAEEIGLIRQIDRWVMRQACAQLAEWQRLGHPAMQMSINVSAAGFLDRDFVETLSNVAAEFGIRPQALELEITEGIFLDASTDTTETIRAVRSLGARIALDDFGTGYSSLGYISRYPIDTIKIDKSFIDGVGCNGKTRAIVELIVGLGTALGVNIVAEGVETQAQTDILIAIGCRAIQGYHFARPLSPADATAMLIARSRPV